MESKISETSCYSGTEMALVSSSIIKYRIYEIEQENQILIAEIDSSLLSWTRRNMNPGKEYIYAISAVNRQGRESEKSFTQIL